MGTCSYCYLGIKIMAKKSLSKLQIELNDNAHAASIVQRENKRAMTKAKKAEAQAREDEMSEFIAAEMEGEI